MLDGFNKTALMIEPEKKEVKIQGKAAVYPGIKEKVESI